jgi:tetratricopeptide (TPR) repeat protein
MPEPFELVSKGLELVEQKKFLEAEQYILKGIKTYEKQKDREGVTFALGRLGYCYEQAGEDGKAREAYEKAVQIGTDIPAIYYGLISILIFATEVDQAFKIAEIWQQKGTQHVSGATQEIFIELSSRLVRQERYNEAVQLLNRTINYFPKSQSPQVYWRIRGLVGSAYEQEGNLDEAIQLYGNAISEGSTDSFTFNRYLINLEKQKNYSVALTIIEKALKNQIDAAWEADLKKRKQRLEQKTGAVPKGTPKALIPDFTIRSGERNLSLLQQIQFSPQLSNLASLGDRFWGTTGGKTPKLFCYRLDEIERSWEIPFEGAPAGLMAVNDRVIVYTRDGRIGEGETKIFFYDAKGNLISNQILPDVPSEVVSTTDRIYAGCRDGNLYAFSLDGNSIWSFKVPGSSEPQDDNYSRPCPYYVAAGKDIVAFTSFGTLYVLNSQGKLQYTWGMPEHNETIKSEFMTIRISTGAPSVVALAAAPVGRNILAASSDTVYELADGKEVRKIKAKLESINRIYWVDTGSIGVCDSEKMIIYDNGKVTAKIPVKGFSQIAINRSANRLVVWSGNNLDVATLGGKLLAEIEFVKSVHSVTCFDNGQLLIGTRYAMLFDTNPDHPKGDDIETNQASKNISVTDKPSISTRSQRSIEENNIPIHWIEAQKLTIGPGKAYYKGPLGKEITIEQVALNDYVSRGFRGIWAENNYWWEIMALLFWDVIFAKLPGVYTTQFGEFPSRLQDMPLDFFQPEFYSRRKQLIEKRMHEFGATKLFGLVKNTPEAELRSAYNRFFGKPCRAIEDWQHFSLDELVISTQVLQKDQLLLILKRLLENFNDNRKGLPDLFLVDANGKALFVEVKGEREKVADHQVKWHHFLRNQVQVPSEICRVIND